MAKEEQKHDNEDQNIDLDFMIDHEIDVDFTLGAKDEYEEMDTKKEVISWIKTILFAVVAALCINQFIIINANIPSGSMENTIMIGDRVVAFRWSYTFSEPQRGDIIVLKYPDDESKPYVKRVIGLPGEKVEIIDGLVYIDDASVPLEEDYVKNTPYGYFGPYYVPEGYYFMLGDNRNNSEDSRYWNNTYLAKDKILGKVIFRYFPKLEWFS